MHYWRTLIRICLVFYLSLGFLAAQSAPSRTLISTTSGKASHFSITQVKNPRWKPYTMSTTEVYAASFLKHKRPMPEPLRTAWANVKLNRSDATTSLASRSLSGQTVGGSDGLYVWPTKIGTPEQTLNLAYDTGAGDFWVWSWLLPAYMIQTHNYYNATNSSSATQWAGQSFGVAYGVGSTYGLIWQDVVWVDGIGVSGNPVECVQNVADFFVTLPPVDGFLGLSNAYNDSERPLPQQTWVSYVLPRIAEPVFTTALVKNGTGTMDFGTIDPTKYIGDISYTPVTIIPGSGGGFWAFNWTGFAIGPEKFNFTNIQVMTDTGGTIVNMPVSITQRYFGMVPGATRNSDGTWSFPCSSSLPSFTFGVGQTGRMLVAGKHMNFGPQSDGVHCLGAIQESDEDSYIYMTLPFLQAIFVVHDYGGMRMGFANQPPGN